MKRLIIILSIALFSTSYLSAQNEEDALRYSRQFISGTARAVGMGGAMGAIGGDFTSLSINPAGIGVYRKGEFTISPSVNWNNTRSSFLENRISQTRYGMKIGNIGYVFNQNNEDEDGLSSISVGIGYTQLNNFNQNIMMSGTNNNSSLLDNFTNIYNDESIELSEFYEILANKVNLIPFDTVNQVFFNDFEVGGYGQDQNRTINSSGSLGEYSFSVGGNYNHKLYFGVSLGLQRVRYARTMEHEEKDQGDQIDYTERFVFTEDLLTRGYGGNLKIGIIARPVSFIRLGAAFHSPTLYFLNDRFNTGIQAWYDADLDLDSEYADSPDLEYDYRLKSPAKFIGSAAVTIGGLGLISVDYERVNYSTANLEGSDYNFIRENKAIEDLFTSADNLRMGAELRLGEGYFRGGYSVYGSPFKSPNPKADSKYSVLSGGIGVRTSDFFIDFSYSKSLTKDDYYMYLPEMSQYNAINTSNFSNVIMTLGFRF